MSQSCHSKCNSILINYRRLEGSRGRYYLGFRFRVRNQRVYFIRIILGRIPIVTLLTTSKISSKLERDHPFATEFIVLCKPSGKNGVLVAPYPPIWDPTTAQMIVLAIGSESLALGLPRPSYGSQSLFGIGPRTAAGLADEATGQEKSWGWLRRMVDRKSTLYFGSVGSSHSISSASWSVVET